MYYTCISIVSSRWCFHLISPFTRPYARLPNCLMKLIISLYSLIKRIAKEKFRILHHPKHYSLYSTATQNTCPQRQNFALEIPTCWYILALPLTPNLKFALSTTPTPDASQWNIGGVGSQMQISCVGHVHFTFLCRFHLRWVANTNPITSGIWA